MDACDWNNPGREPYTGTPAAAIERMPLPAHVKGTLIARALRNDYDDLVQIRGGLIAGVAGHEYEPRIAFMSFGTGRVCKTIKFEDTPPQQAMVFCEAGYCVARPSVCNNWSMIYRKIPAPVALPEGFRLGEPQPVRNRPVQTIPEPSSLWLAAVGFVALIFGRKKARARRASVVSE